MWSGNVLETAAGLLLVFFVPGFLIAKALFPEWRLRGPLALRRAVEIVTLSFVLSVALTILLGYVLLSTAPGGFRTSWSEPTLEIGLVAVALIALGSGVARGAYRREPPPAPVPEPTSGDEGAFELTQRLDRLRREERRLEHELRVGAHAAPEDARLRYRLQEIRQESDDLRQRREREYAS